MFQLNLLGHKRWCGDWHWRHRATAGNHSHAEPGRSTSQSSSTLRLEIGKHDDTISQELTELNLLINFTRKGRDKFEEFAAPLIHLSGFLVNIVKTEHVSEARELVELIEKTNMIGVAGGDGTLMEVSLETDLKLEIAKTNTDRVSFWANSLLGGYWTFETWRLRGGNSTVSNRSATCGDTQLLCHFLPQLRSSVSEEGDCPGCHEY